MAIKNVAWSYGSMIVTTILKFICRTAFINTIGEKYLGVNGLFTSVLNVLSLTELGIGSAMSFSLYKPVADNDIERLKSLMLFYKKAYQIVATVVAVLGIILVPFLKYLIKDASGLENLTIYYLIFLFNTVSSYFISYKYSLNNAAQRNYIITNIDTVSTVVMTGLQIAALYIFNSFLLYLLIQSACLLFSKVFISCYLNKLYPYLKDKKVIPLDKASRKNLSSDVGSLMIHKLGDVAVNQTDNIIVSSMISISATGLISNYTLITSTVNSLLGVMFNNVTGSLGNLCATENKEARYKIYKVYEFIGCWFFGFAAIAYFSLVQPFITLMWGQRYLLEVSVVTLIILNTYMVGQRIPLNNMKVASGLFAPDKFLPLLQAIINLVVSIVGVQLWGLVGVYIGTIVSGIIPSVIRPITIYRKMFDKSVINYYKDYFLHFSIITIVGFANYVITSFVMTELTIITFAVAVVITAILPNLLILLIHIKTEECKYVKNIIFNLFKSLLKRKAKG